MKRLEDILLDVVANVAGFALIAFFALAPLTGVIWCVKSILTMLGVI